MAFAKITFLFNVVKMSKLGKDQLIVKQNRIINKKKIMYVITSILCLVIIYAALVFFNAIPVIGTIHVRGIFSGYDYMIKNNEIYLTRYHGNEVEVNIPDKILFRKVVSIGISKNTSATKEGTFQDNQKITSVKIPDTVKFIGALSFTNCKNLTVAKLPDNLETIGEKAFAHTSIIQIVIPQKTQYIYGYAFLDCTKLIEANVGKSVKYMGNSVFGRTPWLEAKKDDFVVVGDGILLKYFGSSKQIVIPDGVKEICGDAFNEYDKANTGAKFTDIEYFKFPSSVNYIRNHALGGNDSSKGLIKLYLGGEDIYFGKNAIGTAYIIIAPKGSPAEKYAIDNGIKYQNQ